MALTRADFLVGYPEFSNAPEGLIERKLSESDARTSPDAFGASREIRVHLLTARLLALCPFARDMRLAENDTTTVYDADLAQMNRAAAFGLARVC